MYKAERFTEFHFPHTKLISMYDLIHLTIHNFVIDVKKIYIYVKLSVLSRIVHTSVNRTLA